MHDLVGLCEADDATGPDELGRTDVYLGSFASGLWHGAGSRGGDGAERFTRRDAERLQKAAPAHQWKFKNEKLGSLLNSGYFSSHKGQVCIFLVIFDTV